MSGARGHGGHEFLPLGKIHDQLHLTPEQEKTWQKLAAETKELRISGQAQRKEIKSQLDQELAHAQPDLARIAALSDRAKDEGVTRRRQLRDEWLKLYAQLSPEQKLVVRDVIRDKLSRFETFRKRFGQNRESRNPS